MASDLAMNINTNDVIIKNGDLFIIDNAERVAQQIQISLNFWLAEWFLDTSQGVPYLEYILVKNPNQAHIQQILTKQIMQVEGIKRLISMDLTLLTVKRILIVEYEVETNYGIVTNKAVLGYGK